jgi:hypothetical protein
VVWNEQNPKWNRQINLGVRVRETMILQWHYLLLNSHSIYIIQKYNVASMKLNTPNYLRSMVLHQFYVGK